VNADPAWENWIGRLPELVAGTISAWPDHDPATYDLDVETLRERSWLLAGSVSERDGDRLSDEPAGLLKQHGRADRPGPRLMRCAA
jgi:hypothetical protein